MPNYIPYYRQYFKREILVPPTAVQGGGFYRLWNYQPVDSAENKSYGNTRAPILMVIGVVKSKNEIHAIKVSEMPIVQFMRFFSQVKNQKFIQESIDMEVNNTFLQEQNLHYRNNGNAYLIDEPYGKSFYTRTLSTNHQLMDYYQIYRTYKIKNISTIKELYFDYKKMTKDFPILGKYNIPKPKINPA